MATAEFRNLQKQPRKRERVSIDNKPELWRREPPEWGLRATLQDSAGQSGAGNRDQVQVQLGEQVAGQAAKEDASTAGDQAKWGSLHFFKHMPGDRLVWDHGVSELGVPHFMGLGEGGDTLPLLWCVW